MVKDPVCGMNINEEDAAGYFRYKGIKYFFCAPACKIKFIKDPKKYVKQNLSGPGSEKLTGHFKHDIKDEQN